MRSMTGFGAAEAPLGTGRVHVEARGVNHRYLEVRVRMPRELADHATFVEQLARRTTGRGRIELLVRLEGEAAGAPVLDMQKARAALAQLSALRDEVRPGEPVPLSLLSCVPDLFSPSEALADEGARAALTAAVEHACEELARMRLVEGRALTADLRARLADVRGHLAALRERLPQVVAAYRERLRERLALLLRSAEVAVDPTRLEQEVALFADRADVAEELTRLDSHTAQLDTLFDDDGETVGRRLDFLLQEMMREANTIGSKSPDAVVTMHVVELKADLERMREQAQNVL
jgi:uncharacterized protein (TIGR00255 family)